jgi:hypothetical protein
MLYLFVVYIIATWQVQEYWKKTMQKTVGYTLTGTDLLGVRACLQMAMRCVEDERDKRPSTREIISDLSKLNDQIEKMPTIVQVLHTQRFIGLHSEDFATSHIL